MKLEVFGDLNKLQKLADNMDIEVLDNFVKLLLAGHIVEVNKLTLHKLTLDDLCLSNQKDQSHSFCC